MTLTPQIVMANDTARTRRTDPLSSHEAADTNAVTASQAFVRDMLFLSEPLADHELIVRCEQEFADYPNMRRYSPSRIRSARHELTEQGAVEFAGYYHLTPGGNRTQVWRLA